MEPGEASRIGLNGLVEWFNDCSPTSSSAGISSSMSLIVTMPPPFPFPRTRPAAFEVPSIAVAVSVAVVEVVGINNAVAEPFSSSPSLKTSEANGVARESSPALRSSAGVSDWQRDRTKSAGLKLWGHRWPSLAK